MKKYLPLLLLIAALPLAAQQRALDRVDSLIAQGRARDARTALQEWQRTSEASTDGAQRARGMYLSARLTEDATQAQEKYLNVALSYPTSREAPEALLRLGQALLTAGEAPRSTTYFDRVIRDYPRSPARGDAYLWLTRAQLMGGNARAACTTASSAKKADLSADLREQLGVEEKLACSPAASSARSAPTITPAPTLPAPAPAITPTAKSSARYSIQFAAFREPGNAAPVAEQLRRAGFDARVTYVEGSPLARVRIGHFDTSEQAHAEANRAKAAGFGGIIVDDVQKEKSQRD